jgi:hydroxylamine reductase
MFCYQCEQTAKGTGCDKSGVCGKKPEVAALQDLLVYTLEGLSMAAVAARGAGIEKCDADVFICKSLFSTLTNVNFDPERFVPLIRQAVSWRDWLIEATEGAGHPMDTRHEVLQFRPAETLEGLIAQGEKVGIKSIPSGDADILSLKHTLLYGLKGVAAYADHALILGRQDQTVYTFIQEGLAALPDGSLSVERALELVLQCGHINLRAMALLDAGNTGTYGHPVPTAVPLGVKKGKAILVSGHDLKDLAQLLGQTADQGITVYTHGEMLPCHGYPELKRHPHFYGHYGTAWQNQHVEFGAFPGAILMTTNCMQRPQPAYQDRIFTTGAVGWPGVTHIDGYDFTPVIEKALSLEGFAEDTNGRAVTTGFARNAVLNVAGTVIEAVKNRQIRHFFLVAGCDGAKPGRNYYTRFVEMVPDDCVVLTLACGKFRFFDRDLGSIGGIPRLLDVGQCNDAYSAIQIAVALSEAFGVGINDLPLSMVLSWYEQKAVAILLTLLALGIRDIRLGPSLPAFVTPGVLNVLVDKFNIKPITTPEEDLKAILGS